MVSRLAVSDDFVRKRQAGHLCEPAARDHRASAVDRHRPDRSVRQLVAFFAADRGRPGRPGAGGDATSAADHSRSGLGVLPDQLQLRLRASVHAQRTPPGWLSGREVVQLIQDGGGRETSVRRHPLLFNTVNRYFLYFVYTRPHTSWTPLSPRSYANN